MLNHETSRRTAGVVINSETYKLVHEYKASYRGGDYDRNKATAHANELRESGYKVRVKKDKYDNFLVYARPISAIICNECDSKMEIYAYVNGIWKSHFYYHCKACGNRIEWDI